MPPVSKTEADPSRVLETWTLAQALPPLGRALDIRDSHPASMNADRPRVQRFPRLTRAGLTDGHQENRRCRKMAKALSADGFASVRKLTPMRRW